MSSSPALVLFCIIASLTACGDAAAPVDAGDAATEGGGTMEASTAMDGGADAMDATVDAPALPDGVVPSPDGEGVCCPKETPAPLTCDCHDIGGWAPTPDECTWRYACDVPPPGYRDGTDEHGCDVWEIVSTESCCNCGSDGGRG